MKNPRTINAVNTCVEVNSTLTINIDKRIPNAPKNYANIYNKHM